MHRVISRIRHNPMPSLVWTLLVALALGIFALLLVGLNPSSLGVLVHEGLEHQVYAFEHLTLTGRYLDLGMRDGRIIPVLRAGQVGGAVVLGRGSYRLELPPDAMELFSALTGLDVLEDGVQALYLPLDYQALEDLKALAMAWPVDDPSALAAAATVLARNREDPALLWVFGMLRRFMPGATSLARIHGYGYPEVFYAEGETVAVTIPSLGPGASFHLELEERPHGFFTAPPPAAPAVVVAAGVFGASVLLILALAYALTADLAPHVQHPRVDRRRLLLLLASLPAVELGGHWLLAGLAWREFPLYLALALAVAGWARRERVPSGYLGLTVQRGGRAVFAGLLVGLAMVLAGALATPQGLGTSSAAQSAALAAGTFLTAGLLPEVYRRGLLHNALERWGGAVLAVGATAYLAALARALPRLLAAGGPTPLFWVETLLLAPLAFVVAGFLYHRTRNVLASATALWLLAFLPQVVRF